MPRAYTAYGYSGNARTCTLLGFNGQAIDAFLESYILGNGVRCYHCSLMRFASPDSFSPFDKGGLNSYAYCGGDPVNRVDPSGHSSARIIRYRNRAPLRRPLSRLAIDSIDDPTLLATSTFIDLSTTSVKSRRTSAHQVQSERTERLARRPWDAGSEKKHWDDFSKQLDINEMTPEKRAKVVNEFVQHQLIKEVGKEGKVIKQKMALTMLWQLGYGADVTQGWSASVTADILARNQNAVRAFVS
ncbi:RHS repeat-associated core domain-containing protein [Pseudomonas sp. NPDC089408]|uniref:RHS repeat-associated core domain-containing protein n=1 Tax=Pseudomonas sp. NPDC089408 TaxID=3364465 RepID=UPI00381BB663